MERAGESDTGQLPTPDLMYLGVLSVQEAEPAGRPGVSGPDLLAETAPRSSERTEPVYSLIVWELTLHYQI